MQAMTEIIPGLQGDIPANSRKGVPHVGGKYEFYKNRILSLCFMFSFRFFLCFFFVGILLI